MSEVYNANSLLNGSDRSNFGRMPFMLPAVTHVAWSLDPAGQTISLQSATPYKDCRKVTKPE